MKEEIFNEMIDRIKGAIGEQRRIDIFLEDGDITSQQA